MILPTKYFLALFFLARAVSSTDNDFCHEEFYADDGYPNALNCTLPTNGANLTKSSVVDLLLLDASDKSYDFNAFATDDLYCCFVSQPYCPTIKWFKDGKELNPKYQEDIKIKEGGRVLRVIRPSPSSNGNYTCTATTPDGKVVSHTIEVKVQVTCNKVSYLNPDPKTEVIEVIRGASQTLRCEYFCIGSDILSSDTWRNGKGELIVPSQNYKLSRKTAKTRDNSNGPDLVQTLTIVNFTKSENITCILKQNVDGALPKNRTFHLVLKECFGTPEIIQTPGGQDVIPVAKGSNKTFTCQFFCLEKENFGNFTWIFGNGKPIPNDISKYILVQRAVHTNELSYGRRRLNYEMRLTIMNISNDETFSCNHSSRNEEQSDSKTFRLDVIKDAREISLSTESFFKRAGLWIVIGILLAMLVFLSFLSFWFRRTINKWLEYVGFGRSSKPSKNALFDAFISYSQTDGCSFVSSKLVPMLEDQCGYKLCLRYRDYPPGAAIVDNTVQSIDASRKILMVITPNFLDSQWRMYEMDQGVLLSMLKPNTLLVIMLNKIRRTELPIKLQRFVDKTSCLAWDDSKSDKMCEKIKTKLGTPLTIKKNQGNSEESAWQQCNSYV